ncbi:MFS transporter [Streptomyces yokosukanensis]|uniref:MFS transporter n=1 Tax=Streptomyces yokosukanensis TaxID=67386 RepID=UPI003415FD3E
MTAITTPSSSSFRRPVWLYALTVAAFAVQTDDFVIVGVLRSIAGGTGRSETAAGQLVTVYSLVYALAAPAWSLLLDRVARRTALLAALAVFCAANFAALFVGGSFPALMALRAVAALAAAVVLPAALAAASTQAPPEQQGRYLATVMTGLTGAVLLGVPAGTWVGAALGWQATFAFGGLLGLAALAWAAVLLPVAERATEHRTVGDLIRPLLHGAVAAVLVVTVLTVAGNLAFQTYLQPFLSGLAGVSPRSLAVLLVCSGAGGILGTQYAGRLVDRWAPLRAFVLASCAFCAALVAFALLWVVRPVPVAVVAVLLMVWSAAAWAVPPSIQALMLARAGTRAAGQAVAVHSSSVYAGAALGGVLGGLVIALRPGLLPVAAAFSVLVALALTLATRTRTAPRARAVGGPERERVQGPR